MITSTQLNESWSRARARLREKFPVLTEDDLVLVEGREEDLLLAVAEKTGRTRESVIDAFHAAGMFRLS